MHALLQHVAPGVAFQTRRRRGGLRAHDTAGRGRLAACRIAAESRNCVSAHDSANHYAIALERAHTNGLKAFFGGTLSALLVAQSASAFTKIELTDLRSAVVDCPSASGHGGFLTRPDAAANQILLQKQYYRAVDSFQARCPSEILMMQRTGLVSLTCVHRTRRKFRQVTGC